MRRYGGLEQPATTGKKTCRPSETRDNPHRHMQGLRHARIHGRTHERALLRDEARDGTSGRMALVHARMH